MTTRRDRLLGDIPIGRASGLEIGALHAPIVRRTEGDIRFVDYAPAEVLRENFRHPGADPGDIVDVDIVWGERPLRECLDAPVDYIVASHVIEHVPDLIGWLLELRAALKPGGILGLAIPDRRSTFDLWRQVSTPGEMVEAWLLGAKRPSPRQIFDAAALSKDAPADAAWRQGESLSGLPKEISRRLAPALDLTRQAIADQRYVDLHCWVFTPASFLDTADMLHRLNCFPFAIDGFVPAAAGDIEFLVRLRAVDGEGELSVAASIAAARQGLRTFERRGMGYWTRTVVRAVARVLRAPGSGRMS